MHQQLRLIPDSADTLTQLPPLPPPDSLVTRYPVRRTGLQSVGELERNGFPADLSTPSNLRTTTEYDPSTGCYIVRTLLGDREIATPIILTPDNITTLTRAAH